MGNILNKVITIHKTQKCYVCFFWSNQPTVYLCQSTQSIRYWLTREKQELEILLAELSE